MNRPETSTPRMPLKLRRKFGDPNLSYSGIEDSGSCCSTPMLSHTISTTHISLLVMNCLSFCPVGISLNFQSFVQNAFSIFCYKPYPHQCTKFEISHYQSRCLTGPPIFGTFILFPAFQIVSFPRTSAAFLQPICQIHYQIIFGFLQL